MSIISKNFSHAAAFVAARLPGFLADEFTLGVSAFGSRKLGSALGDWYKGNDYYKFPVDQVITYKWPDGTPGPSTYAADKKVTGYEHVPGFGDMYLTQSPTGAIERHFKWNLESQFRSAPQKNTPRSAIISLAFGSGGKRYSAPV